MRELAEFFSPWDWFDTRPPARPVGKENAVGEREGRREMTREGEGGRDALKALD